MIYETLECFAGELNEFFRSKLRITEDKVVVSSIVNQDGTVAIQGDNKLVITLISLEKETVGKLPNGNGSSFSANNLSPLALSLQVLCSSYFVNNYIEGLRFLTMLIAYLQQKPVFTVANTPALDTAIDKLTFDMESTGMEKQSNIWSMIGAKHMPSVLYKIRMIVFDAKMITEYRPLTQGVQGNNNVIH